MGLIRFLLACFVVIFHASPYWRFLPMPGDLSVQCFYIISGFYMALILNEKYTGRKSTWTFYSNRVLKIYPIYFVLLLVLVAWAALVRYKSYPGTFDFYSEYWPLPLTTLLYLLFVNLFLMGIDTVFYLGINPNGTLYFTKNINLNQPYVVQFAFNPYAWTIGVELLFYLIAPLIVRKKIWVPLLLIALSLFTRIYLASIGLNFSPWNYMFFPNQLMFFMGGVISYHLYRAFKQNPPSKWRSVMVFLLFIMIITFYSQIPGNAYYKQALLFCFEVAAIPYAFILTKGVKADRYIGNLSFPIYLSQALVLKIVVAKSFPKIISHGFTTLAITIGLSILLHHFIAQPIERYRQRRIAS
ncbi:acyltransferase family protein [Mucilaginibacter lutimaris]|uniref:Acyltransferase family protein n=1 Tax=Mucilaginibacter lutimaris TaxID=931629 RepID=A0ABW2ZGD8_9SPHI